MSAVSDEQELAIGHGLRRGVKSWKRRSAPTPPFSVPAWCRDAHIDWMDSFSNFPQLQLRLNYDPLEAAGISTANIDDLKPMWHQPKPGVFVAQADGMGSVHYHSGAISKRYRKLYINDECQERFMLATTQQEGFAGRSFFIRMAEDEGELSGQLLELRGPWHGGSPIGFVEVHCRLATAERDARDREFARKYPRGEHPERWYNLGGFTFGWYVGEITLLNIFAEKMPEIEWADVDHGNWKRLEPIDPRTGCPKGFTPAEEIK